MMMMMVVGQGLVGSAVCCWDLGHGIQRKFDFVEDEEMLLLCYSITVIVNEI